MTGTIRPFTIIDECEDCEDVEPEQQVGTGAADFTEARDLAADVAVFVRAALELRSYGATGIKVNEYYVEFPPLAAEDESFEVELEEPEPAPKKRTRKAR